MNLRMHVAMQRQLQARESLELLISPNRVGGIRMVKPSPCLLSMQQPR